MNKFIYFISFLVSSTFAQSTKELYNLSTQAYQSKDYKKFLEITQKLDSLPPSHPTYTYNLACAYALNHDADKSIAVLEKSVLMNNAIDFQNEPDLEFIKTNQNYKTLVQLQLELNKSIKKSNKVIQLSEKELHVESVLYLKKSKKWLANSIRNRKIVSFDIKTGQCSDWFTDNDMLAVFAMKADKNEKTLWVTTSAIPEMKGYTSSFEGKSEILQIDCKTKKIVQRFQLQGNHALGDLMIKKNGEVYISDSGEPKIYKIANGKLTVWLDLQKEAFNLQGITINNNESTLFIADYLKGILKINTKNPKDRKWLNFPKNAVSKGIDGLVYYKNSLIAIQNGVKPIRIVQFLLDQNQELKSFEILDHNRPEFNEPTNGCVTENKLYFIANSPWSAYDKNFNLIENKLENPMLFSTQLKNEGIDTKQQLKATEIIKKSLSNVASRTKLSEIKNIITSAKCTSPNGKYTTESHTDNSDYSYFKQIFEFEKSPFEAVIYAKKEGYEISSNKEKLDLDAISMVRGHEFINSIIDLEKRFYDFETPQLIATNNNNQYKIKAKNESGKECTLFFDFVTNNLESIHFSNPSNPNEIIVTSFSDRKEIDGFTLPFHVEIEQGGKKYAFDYQWITINSPKFVQKRVF